MYIYCIRTIKILVKALVWALIMTKNNLFLIQAAYDLSPNLTEPKDSMMPSHWKYARILT